MNEFMQRSARQVKRLIVGVVGLTVVFIGIVMIVLPGPAILVIPIGLGILATEFVWARRLLKTVKGKFNNAMRKGTSSREQDAVKK
jgi:uncharacterized protein (TIGR02611 family)